MQDRLVMIIRGFSGFSNVCNSVLVHCVTIRTKKNTRIQPFNFVFLYQYFSLISLLVWTCRAAVIAAAIFLLISGTSKALLEDRRLRPSQVGTIARGASPVAEIQEDITEVAGAAAITAIAAATFPALTHAGEETIRMGTPNAVKNGADVAALETRTEMVKLHLFYILSYYDSNIS